MTELLGGADPTFRHGRLRLPGVEIPPPLLQILGGQVEFVVRGARTRARGA
jgi:hypothetical protein